MFFVDTDILSAFVKVGGIKYLKQAVPKVQKMKIFDLSS